MKNLKIGQQVYCVHNTYISLSNKSGSKVLVCRIKGYENYKDKVIPILKVVGGKGEPHSSNYFITTDIDEAIEKITTVKEVKIKSKSKKS